MANPIYLQITAAGTYILPLDSLIDPFQTTWQVYVPSGTTVSYTVEYTIDALNPIPSFGYGNLVAVTQRWTTLPNNPGPFTTTQANILPFPVTAIRINVASISGGDIEAKVLQPYSIN